MLTTAQHNRRVGHGHDEPAFPDQMMSKDRKTRVWIKWTDGWMTETDRWTKGALDGWSKIQTTDWMDRQKLITKK